MHFTSTISGIALSAVMAIPAAAATLAGYPPPGGASYSSVGSHLHGTATWTYSGLDPSEWDQLWWGFDDMGFAMDGGIDQPAETMSLLSASGGVATYTGQTQVNTGTSSAPNFQTVHTRAVAQLVNGSWGWVGPGSVGIASPTMLIAAEIDGSTDFILDFSVTASFAYNASGAGYSAFLPFYDAATGSGVDGTSRASFYRDFYYTAAVPLPAGLPLLALGLGGLWAVRRRKRD